MYIKCTYVSLFCLKHACDDFFLLIRAAEHEVRKATANGFSHDTLLVDPLVEQILSSFLVKHHWDNLTGQATTTNFLLLEHIIRLFLKVRGFAVAKYFRRSIQKENKGKRKPKVSGNSLRKCLKERNQV